MSITAATYASLSPHVLCSLSSVVSSPGSIAADLADVQIGDGRQVSARLRLLREAGLVQAEGPSPARWYPTAAGRRVVSRQRLVLLRERSRETLRQLIVTTARAEALYAFADTLTQPGQSLLCPPPRHRILSFSDLASTLRQSVGCDVSVATVVERVWPQVHPITAIGLIDGVVEERSWVLEDWLITFTVGETAFVEFSRRHFQGAKEDRLHRELCVRQQGQTTAIWFEPPFL
jgi:hypothetical protein